MNFDESVNERRSVTGIALRWSHITMVLVVWLVTVILAYATLRGDTNQNTRDIQEIKANQVSREQMQEFREDVQRRLQRIEDKLDRDKELRQLR